MKHYDLIIIGAGSGGIGAALAAGRLGLRVLLVEKQGFIGGNAAQSGVSVWEMGTGGTGIPFDIYKRLKQIPEAVGIYSFRKHRKWQLAKGETPLHPGAELRIDGKAYYAHTLRRHGSESGIANEAFVRKYWHGVPFEPAAYQRVVASMLEETGRVELLKATAFQRAEYQDGRVLSLRLSNGEAVSAPYYVDSTDNAVLCRAVGCETMFGQEPHARFSEPGAPEVVSDKINGVSLIYRITPRKEEGFIESIPPQTCEPPVPQCWWADEYPVASIAQYPNGDLNVNMLPTMEGVDFVGYDSYRSAYEECRRRVLAHFEHLRDSYPPYRDYRIVWIAPALGVRESQRVVGEYVLKEQDIREGLSKHAYADIVTIADHALDTHGKSTGRAGCAELEEPYGVPFRCLIPRGFSNLLVASRAASFSSLAASSCRLSRTMMQLGQAAGTAAFLAKELNTSFNDLPYPRLRELLLKQHVQLEFPVSEALVAYLENE